jgi:hypothetical protein
MSDIPKLSCPHCGEVLDLKTTVWAILAANKNALYIGRVFPKTKEDFTKFADERYCNDFGAALEELLRSYFLTDAKFAKLDEKIDCVINWVNEIQAKVDSQSTQNIEAKKMRKSISGVPFNERKREVEGNGPGTS